MKILEFKFPVIENEKFVAESLVWNRMAEKYSFLYFNEVVYIADYQEDGLSSQSIVNRRRNPKYATLLYKELTEKLSSHNIEPPLPAELIFVLGGPGSGKGTYIYFYFSQC